MSDQAQIDPAALTASQRQHLRGLLFVMVAEYHASRHVGGKGFDGRTFPASWEQCPSTTCRETRRMLYEIGHDRDLRAYGDEFGERAEESAPEAIWRCAACGYLSEEEEPEAPTCPRCGSFTWQAYVPEASSTEEMERRESVERIREEALQRVRKAFYTGGLLALPRTASPDEFRAAIRTVFGDVMLAAEPGQAERAANRLLRKAPDEAM